MVGAIDDVPHPSWGAPDSGIHLPVLVVVIRNGDITLLSPLLGCDGPVGAIDDRPHPSGRTPDGEIHRHKGPPALVVIRNGNITCLAPLSLALRPVANIPCEPGSVGWPP